MKGFEWLHFARTRIIIWFVIGFFIGFGIMLTVMHARGSTIEVGDYIVDEGDVFLVNIVCHPTQPIKAWEFVLHHSPLLTVVNVTPGDFFKGYMTFMGSVNATWVDENDSITHLYDLVIGPGNASNNGTVIAVLFRANKKGTAPITISGAGVTNETRYLDLTVQNGSVLILALRSWGQKCLGWNSFGQSQKSVTGWSTFANNVTVSHGWSSFQNVRRRPDNSAGAVIGAIISIAFVLIIIVMLLKRFK